MTEPLRVETTEPLSVETTEPLSVETPHGVARITVRLPPDGRTAAAWLLLGHGAGGGIGARDLQAVAEVASAHGYAVGLVEQPYRVAGRRSPAPARQLDAAWEAVAEHIRTSGAASGTGALVVGGRSSGARVACRTAATVRADGVLCLAFPLLAPARRGNTGGERASRLGELDAVTVPVLVVQGTSDPFGMPPDAPGRTVVPVRGTHSLTTDLAAVRAAAAAWLPAFVPGRTG